MSTVQEVKASFPSGGVNHVLAEGAQQPPAWQSPEYGRAPAATPAWQNWGVFVAGITHRLTDTMLSDVPPAKETSWYGT